jgi:hypothetical protein
MTAFEQAMNDLDAAHKSDLAVVQAERTRYLRTLGWLANQQTTSSSQAMDKVIEWIEAAHKEPILSGGE